MNKMYLIIVVILTGLALRAAAQNDGGVSIGKGNSDADPSAILELVSSDKGLLIPRLTESEREGISSPASGLLVYDTDKSSFYYWSGKKWEAVGGTAVVSGTTYPETSREGDLFYNTGDKFLYIYVSGEWEQAGAAYQNLSLDGTRIKISNGNSVDLSSLIKEDQQITLSGSVLSLTNGGTVDLSSLLKLYQVSKASEISISSVSGLTATNVQDAISELKTDSGDMLKSVYDTDKNGVVDNAAKVNGHTVQTDVPTGATFTDSQSLSISGTTIYLTGSSTSVTLPSAVTGGDMTKSVYDTNSNSVVDLAESVSDNAITSAKIANQTIQDTDLSGITGSGTSGQILSSNGSGGFTWSSASSGSSGTVSLSGDITGTSSAAAISSGVIVSTDLNASNTPVSGQVPSYNSSTGGFTWVSAGTSGGSTGDMLKSTYDTNTDGIVDIAATVSNNAITSAKIADQTIKDTDLEGITTSGISGRLLAADGGGGFYWTNAGGGSVTTVSVTTANGISGSVSSASTAPAITLTLGSITPSSVTATGAVLGSNLSGTNTGDNAINTTYDTNSDGQIDVIGDDAILESSLAVSNTAGNGQVLSYNSTTGGFTWINSGSGTGDMLKSVYDSDSNGKINTIDDDVILESSLAASNTANNGQVLSYNSSTTGFTWITAGNMSTSTYDTDADGKIDYGHIASNAITTAEIASSTILPSDLNSSNAAATGKVLSYDSTTGGFTWIDNGSGSGSGISSVTGTANQITATTNSGAVTLTLPAAISVTTSVTAPNFYGNATTATTATKIAGGTAGAIPYQTGVGVTSMLSAGTSGYVLTSTGTGSAPSWQAAPSGFTNPMNTAGDLIIGGALGAASRLAAGTSGYVLTSNGAGTAPSWNASFSNPMTTTGDIIYRSSSGTADRLAAGTSGYVLTSNGAGTAPSWQAGFTNPMTTTGDIIYQSSTGAARLGKGTAGQVLTMNAAGTLPEWQTPASGGALNVSTYSTTTYTVTDTDQLIVSTGTANSTINLPDASSSNKGRVIYVVETTTLVTVSFNQSIVGSANTCSAGYGAILISTGSQWVMVSAM